MSTNFKNALAAFRDSHTRLSERVRNLDAQQLRQPSYASEWTIADTLSHVGSQAEIMSSLVEAVRSGDDMPGQDMFVAVWDVWNAKSPEDQRDGSIEANEMHISALEALSDEEVAAFSFPFFGREFDAAGFVSQLRIAEHPIHSWDVEVALDPTATLYASTVPLLLDNTPSRAAQVAKPNGTAAALRVDTSSPEQSFAFSITPDNVTLEPWNDQTVSGEIRIPAEAFIRLISGRLDPEHTPESFELKSDDITIEELRTIYPGY